jgi:hypothetical protein
LIISVDNSIRKETDELKNTFIAACKCHTVDYYLNRLATTIFTQSSEYITSSALPTPTPPMTENDQTAILQDVEFTVVQIQKQIDAYVSTKREKAMLAMSNELQSLYAQAESNQQPPAIQLQVELKNIMDTALRNETNFWRERSMTDEDTKALMKIYKRNMQLAAQICILRELH